MDTKKASKIITYIIYILIFTLSFLILYNLYLIYKNISTPSIPPKNSARVSPLTGEEITNVSYKNHIIKVTYDENIKEYGGLSNASIIFEENKNSSKLVSALFMKDDLIKDSSMKVISENYSNNITNINFISKDDLNKYYNTSFDSIKIKPYNTLPSSFLFFGDTYHHFTSDKEDIDYLNGDIVTYSNVVLDISKIVPDTLLIFTGGKIAKSSTNSEIYLLTGKTYWLTLNSNDLIAPSYEKIQESLN